MKSNVKHYKGALRLLGPIKKESYFWAMILKGIYKTNMHGLKVRKRDCYRYILPKNLRYIIST